MSKKDEGHVVVTRSGYEDMTAELTHLRTVRRQEVARQLEEARAFGDLSENAEYAAAKEEQSKLEGRILELESILGKVSVVDEAKLDTGRVAIGLTVTLDDLDRPGTSHTYMLVGSEELSSASGPAGTMQRISQKSPVGQAILGRAVGDEVLVKIPRGTRRLRIAAISRGEKGRSAKPKVAPKTTAPVDAGKAAKETAKPTKAKSATKEAKGAAEAKPTKAKSATKGAKSAAEAKAAKPAKAKSATKEAKGAAETKPAKAKSATKEMAAKPKPKAADGAPTKAKKTKEAAEHVEATEAAKAEEDAS